MFNVVSVATLLVTGAVPKYDCSRSAPFHPRIHNLGNVGLGGWIHARLARTATTLIDHLAYDGDNVRRQLAKRIARQMHPDVVEVLEVGCGVGTLTLELSHTNRFHSIHAVDTSRQMIDVARQNVKDVHFDVMNGVDVNTCSSDLTVASFVMHELPCDGQREVLNAMIDASRRGTVWIMDIHPTYTPSRLMLSGEPYILDYLEQFEALIEDVSRTRHMQMDVDTLARGRVMIWCLREKTRHSSHETG